MFVILGLVIVVYGMVFLMLVFCYFFAIVVLTIVFLMLMLDLRGGLRRKPCSDFA